jgi:hypothetical protein
MKLSGGCYCKAVRYEVDSDPVMKAECLCRECQYITGGGPNFFMAVAPAAFRYVAGEPKGFKRTDIPNGVTREFCPECGTHLATLPNAPIVVVKVGTLDDPSAFGGPDVAIFTVDRQAFHAIAEGVPQFERMPGRG